MVAISNLDVYNNSMKKTLADKAWFVEKLPPEINTIVDYGGADGSLCEYIRDNFDRKFEFIIIDANFEMQNLALEKFGYSSVFKSLEEYWKFSDALDKNYNNPYGYTRKTACINFSSVLHEVYNYADSFEETAKFINDVKEMNFGAITIRDMNLEVSDCGKVYLELEDYIKNSSFNHLYEEYLTSNISEKHSPFDFLMKYFYTENWLRESIEYYFQPWKINMSCSLCFNKYREAYEEYYSLEYLRNKWKKDFGLTDELMNEFRTHCKKLYLLKEIL